MKASYYNTIIRDNGLSYWFNALSFSHFILDTKLSEKIEGLLDTPEEIKDNAPLFYDRLVDYGFLIPDDLDELALIRERNEKAINWKLYKLTIIPTLNCNYKCWYCIQDHIPSIMSDETMAKIKRHIAYMIDVEGIEGLHIEWFGGEPFMFYDRIMKPLSLYAKKLCAEKGIPFTNGSTTNGYFINEKVAGELDDLCLHHFQITLDGNREFHDKVKFQNGCESTFDYVLGNIDRMMRNSDRIQLTLRINYTHDNLSNDIVGEVSLRLSPEIRKRITILPRKVWQKEVDRSYVNELYRILDLFEEMGFRVERWSPIRNYIPCYASRKYYNSINYNGHLLKCTASDDMYREEPMGYLEEDGSIHWNGDFGTAYQCKSFENERCLACRRLPVCMGQCPRNHLAGITDCCYDLTDETFEAALLDYLRHEHKVTKQ